MVKEEGKENWVDYYVYPDQSLIIERFHGRVDLNLLKKASNSIWTDPSYHKQTKGLVDLRNSSFSLSTADLFKLASFFIANNATTKAFVVILAEDTHTIAQSYILNSRLSTLMNLHIVSSFESALRNLGISESKYAIIDSDQAHRIIE